MADKVMWHCNCGRANNYWNSHCKDCGKKNINHKEITYGEQDDAI